MMEAEHFDNNDSVYVPRHQEQEIAAAQGIEFRRLKNGMTLIGVGCEVEAQSVAKIDFISPTGSFADPKDKEGLHHFMEHIVIEELGLEAKRRQLLFNASTGSTQFTINVERALANPYYRNVGIWPFLPRLRELFNNPFYFIQDVHATVEKEKGVIAAEIAEREYYSILQKIEHDSLYADNHPYWIDVLGKVRTIQSFTDLDVYKAAQLTFRPEDLVVSTYAEGKRGLAGTITDEIEGLFSNYQGQGPTPERPKIQDLDLLNPEFQPGKHLRYDLGSGTGLTRVNLYWELPYDRFSPEDFAQLELKDVIDQRLMITLRKKGLGYVHRTRYINLYKKRILALDYGIPTKSISENDVVRSITPNLINHVVGQIPMKEIEERSEYSQAILHATPIRKALISYLITDSINREGKLVDTRRILQNNKKGIEAKKISRWQNAIASTEPMTVVYAM